MIERTNVCGGSTAVQFCAQNFHLQIVHHGNGICERARAEEANAREPVGALAGITSAQKRVHDRVALAQVGKIARDCRSHIGVIVGDKVRECENFSSWVSPVDEKALMILLAHLHDCIRPASMPQPRRDSARGCCTTGT